MWKASIFVSCVIFAMVGCDYGIQEGEDSLTETAMEHETDWDTKCAALVGIHGEPLLKDRNHTKSLLAGKMEISAIRWMKNLPPEDEDRTDICDCTGMCNACMDAYICGHEAAMLEYCDDCAQCQKECTPDTDD